MKKVEKEKLNTKKIIIIMAILLLLIGLVITIIAISKKDHKHIEVVIPAVEATCTETGLTEGKKCSECGEILKAQEEVAAKGHQYGEWVVVEEATADKEGLEERTCSVCNDKQSQNIPVVEHVHNFNEKVVEPTCTEKGYTEYTCACGETKKDKEVEALGHTEEVLPAKEATCTETGLTEGKKCSECGEILKAQEEVAAKGHQYGEWVVVEEATADKEGLEERTCSVCNDKQSQNIPVVEHVHNFNEKVVEPTCTKKGYTEYTCACGETKKDKEVEALGHTEEVLAGKKATCTETGLTEGKKCSKCGEILKAQTEIAKLAHKEEAIPGFDATCEETGLTEGKKCSTCGEILKAQTVIAKAEHIYYKGECLLCHTADPDYNPVTPHTHTEVVLPAKEATCEETGLTEGKKCSTCGEILKAQEEVPAKGHSYEKGKCTVCGADDPNYEDKVEISNLTELKDVLDNTEVDEFIVKSDIVLDETFVIDRDVTIDLNGKNITTVESVIYPDASTLTVDKDCTLTIKNGTIKDVISKVDGGIEFIRVFANAKLNMENVDIVITVTPEVKWNNTMDRWQTNSAEHNVIKIGSDAEVTLKDTNIKVISPEITNFNVYTRNPFTIVGVRFSTNSNNSKFVMDGGSFSMLVTNPKATTKTDTLYFVKADRTIETNQNATNTVELLGDVKVTIGGLNTAGKLNSTNKLFWLGEGYYKQKTYYSGLKTITMSTEATLNIDGIAYNVNTTEAKVWDVENICQDFGMRSKDKAFYNSTEIKYHFACTACGNVAELTLAELANHESEWGTKLINGITLTKCPQCTTGGLQLQDN